MTLIQEIVLFELEKFAENGESRTTISPNYVDWVWQFEILVKAYVQAALVNTQIIL